MTAPILEPGLKMLAYLSEHGGGRNQRIWLDPKPVIRGLGISAAQFAADSAGLVELGLAGVRKYAPDAAPVPMSPYCAIWITGKGEDYMRTLRRTHPKPAEPEDE